MSTDFEAFLSERIAEDRRKAEAATPGPWRTPGPDSIGQWMIYDAEWSIACATAYSHNDPMSNRPRARGPAYIDPDANAEHIARWDPVRVLAECDAKEAILAAHANRPHDACRVCAEDEPYELIPLASPCPTLKALALPYANHPDYRVEWKHTKDPEV